MLDEDANPVQFQPPNDPIQAAGHDEALDLLLDQAFKKVVKERETAWDRVDLSAEKIKAAIKEHRADQARIRRS